MHARHGFARTLVAGAVIASFGLLSATAASAQTTTTKPGTTACASLVPDGPVFVTPDCTDPGLAEPYTDKDEQRTTTDPATKVKVSYRYIHGGFTGTKARFSFYFPATAKYQGRFFESTYPTVSQEDADPGVVAFAISNGAYVVSTNNNGGLPLGGVLAGYRTNASAANYSRVVAKKVYGDLPRPRGYIFGGSGGAYQTMAAMENTEGVWDGGIPMVPGTPNSIPSNMTVQILVSRVLGDSLDGVVDAMEPGGSGDPYAGLTDEQRTVLQEATKQGFPLRGWWQYASLTGGAFTAVEGGIQALDGGYVDDFWTVPGYEGSDPTVAAARVQHDTTVQSVDGTTVKLAADPPTGDFIGASLSLKSGAAAGKTLLVANVAGNEVKLTPDADTSVTRALQPGDQVQLDNTWNLALQYYQRHQVPSPDQYGWNQFRGSDGGVPLFPQRPQLVGETFVKSIGGSLPTGKFHGKMIMLSSVLDVQAFPWSADWYRQRAEEASGAESTDANYRLWYMDNADHTPPVDAAATHIVSYEGELQQAVLDLDHWVKDGDVPAESTTYTVDDDNQVHVTGTVAERKGVQPVVTVSAGANGSERVEVSAGKAVSLSAKVEVPPNGGKIVRVEWDFDGSGEFAEGRDLGAPSSSATVSAKHTYSKPGTYFAVVRVTARRGGDASTPYQQIQNLARIRVEVR